MSTITVDSEAESRRAEILASLDPKLIINMTQEELLGLQGRLGYGNEWKCWEIPEAWAPASHRSRGQRIVRFHDESPEADAAWTEILRLALVRSLVRGQKYGVPKPLTVRNEVRTAAQLVPLFLERESATQRSWWGRVTAEELVELKGARGATLAQSLSYLYKAGYLYDRPAPREQDGALERNRKGEKAPRNRTEEAKQWQPLPDEFTGQCGQRVLWLVKNLGPSLLSLIEHALKAESQLLESRPQLSESQVYKHRNEVIREWDWSTPEGAQVHSLPFALSMKRKVLHMVTAVRTGRPAYADFAWPPQTWGEVMQMVALLQTCHAWILFLAAGPRASTVLGFEEDCIEPIPGGHRLKGMQFKNSDEVRGRARDWPAPPIVLRTTEQQIRLARLIKQLGGVTGPHLWVQTHKTQKAKGGVGARLNDLNDSLASLVRKFDLCHLLGTENPNLHTHRFRKTLARIVALTLTNAQMVLMDCFGHDDPEMTLRRYILSDPAIVADVQQVQRELVVLMAQEAIEDSERLGGPMGEHVRQEKARYMRVHQKSSLDPQDTYELAESLTLQGRDWVVVIPGVICTLPVGFTGPCAARQGGRNPGNCQSDCVHQLLTAYNQSECDDTVRFVLEQLERAVNESADLMVALWVGQLHNWLYRWKSVYEKWAHHPLVIKHGNPQGLGDLSCE